VLAVAAAVITCAFSTAGAAALAAEGLFILAYLLAADAPPGLARPVPWLRRQVPLLLAGLIAVGAVLPMDAVHLAATDWITVACLAAGVAAYLIALTARRPAPSQRTAVHLLSGRPQTLPARRPQTLPSSRPRRSRSRKASSRPDSV